MEFILYLLISWSVIAYLVTTAKRGELAGCVIIYTVVNLTIVSLMAVIREKLNAK